MSERLPRWVWDMVIDVLDHEDVHSADCCVCLDTTLARVPKDIREKADAIRLYIREKPQS